MKKSFLHVGLFLIMFVTTQAQRDSTLKKQTFHGIVKNEKNKPIQNASVMVKGEEQGIFTDSLGFFKIITRPDAILLINAEGYQTFITPARTAESVKLVKNTAPDNIGSNESARQQSTAHDFRNYVIAEGSKNYTGSYLMVFKPNEGTVGSRLLLNEWVDAKLYDKDDKEISHNGFVLNYDKMEGKLLATMDKSTIIEIEGSALKSFTFPDSEGKEIMFKKITGIDKDRFLIVLAEEAGKPFSLYKSIKTEFVKANYQSNGLIQSGKKYDEYVDKAVYYILSAKPEKFAQVELKEKSLKKALPEKEDAITKFFDTYKPGKMTESTLIQLIAYINQ